MTESIAGGCQCGQVRYRIESPRPAAYVCHCRECQKQSASAFGLSMPVPAEQLRAEGKVAFWERSTDLGSRTRCFFCPVCGSRVYHASSISLDRVTIKGGSLDDTSGLHPAAHIWVSRKQPWVVIPDGMPTHPTQPGDLAAWRRELVGADA